MTIDFDIPKVRRRDTVPYPLALGEKTFILETRCGTIETPEVRNYLFTRPTKPELSAEATPAERDARVVEDLIDTIGRCCIASWDVTSGGAAVECTPERGVEFLTRAFAAFPEETRAYLYWAHNPANFREPIADAESVGKK